MALSGREWMRRGLCASGAYDPDMFFDASGASLVLDADQILDVAAEGRLGGWSFSLDNVGLSILQNNFRDCHFSGTFGVPLVEGKIGYSCQIQKLDKVDEASKTEGKEYAYIFKTQQVDNLNFDFFLAKAEMNKKRTYLLVESVPEKGKQKTRVELLMGGVMDIGGGSMLKDKNLDFRRFCYRLRFHHNRSFPPPEQAMGSFRRLGLWPKKALLGRLRRELDANHRRLSKRPLYRTGRHFPLEKNFFLNELDFPPLFLSRAIFVCRILFLALLACRS